MRVKLHADGAAGYAVFGTDELIVNVNHSVGGQRETDAGIGVGLGRREHVIAGVDCGVGGRCYPDIGWAKLGALTEGAALASKMLWP